MPKNRLWRIPMPGKGLFLTSTTIALLCVSGNGSAQSVHTYRYSLELKSGESQFTGEPRAALRGKAVRVKKDSLDRIIQVSNLTNGKTTSYDVYHYSGNEILPSSYDYFSDGKLIFKIPIQRNANGDRIRVDYNDPSGEPVSYSTRSINGDVVETIDHPAKPSFLSIETRTVAYYSPKGLLVRQESHVGSFATLDFAYDEMTGLATSSKDFYYDKFTRSAKYAYDDGISLRDEFFDSTGTLNGVDQYENGLKSSSQRTFSDGDSKRQVFTYDSTGLAKATKLYRKDKLICTLTYQYLRGKIKRTVARGPSGDLWAEYPGLFVQDVDSKGHPIDDSEAGVIHKTGDWW
jgi:antitoxin component YwqK of YwqJK toxin-antitoxin module